MSKKAETARPPQQARLAQEVENNYQKFLGMSFADLDRGKWALLKDGAVVEILLEKSDANKMGAKLFPDGIYSVQQIGAMAQDLGYMSYAMHSD